MVSEAGAKIRRGGDDGGCGDGVEHAREATGE